MNRINFQVALTLLLAFCLCKRVQSQNKSVNKIPIIVITDLYHPAQDPGDNFDLLMAYALPQIDLKAVILDCTEPFRQHIAVNPGEGLYPDSNGPREAGYIPMLQLNYIFDRSVPFAAGPFYPMKNENDKMPDIPKFQQQGIELLIKTLKESPVKIQILSFGSARILAVAYNREPALFKKKVERIHLSAGAAGPDFLEWNVALDRVAIKTILHSKLPVALYPCAADTANGIGYGSYNYPFSYDEHNSFYKLPNLNFIFKMDTVLQCYLAYSFKQSMQNDFLRAMENDTVLNMVPGYYNHEHYLWETAVWLQVAKMKLVYTKAKKYSIIPENKVAASDKIITNELHPCKVKLCSNGYTFQQTKQPSNFSIFYRNNPLLYEKAMQQALPDLYVGFKAALKNRYDGNTSNVEMR